MASLNFRRRLRCDRGAEIVEFALIFPLLLLVMFGIVDFGFLFQRYEVLTNAAREGARVAALPGYAQADVEARVRQYLTASSMTATPTFSAVILEKVKVGAGGTPPCITLTGITVTYQHQFIALGGIIRLFGGSGFTTKTLTATAKMRYEGVALACP